MQCFYQRDDRAYPLDEERRRVDRFFDGHRCGTPADPSRPTILVVGDFHAAHLFAGLDRLYGARANIMALAAVFCVPLVETVEMDRGVAGTPRCRAINDTVFRRIREIKPDVLVVGGYFGQYDHEANWRYPGFLDAMVAGARKLHGEGVPSIVIAGEVPTWAPALPILVGRDLLETGAAAEFSRVGVRPELDSDRQDARGEGLGAGRRLRVAGGQALRPARLPAARRREPARRPAGGRLWPLQHRGVDLRGQDHPRAGDRRSARKDAALAIGDRSGDA